MTKKQFIALADAIRGTNASPQVLSALVRFCLAQNPRFNERRWLDYIAGKCGPNGGARKEVKKTA